MVLSMAEDKKTASDLVPAKEVAKVLGKSVYTVVRHLRDGSLPGGFHPWERGPWYMRRSAFEALMKQGEVTEQVS